jgi:hypothetical protein
MCISSGVGMQEIDEQNTVSYSLCCFFGIYFIERQICVTYSTAPSDWYITINADAPSYDYLIFISYLYMDIEHLSIRYIVFMSYFIYFMVF